MEKYIREQNFNFRYKSQWIMASLFLFFFSLTKFAILAVLHRFDSFGQLVEVNK